MVSRLLAAGALLALCTTSAGAKTISRLSLTQVETEPAGSRTATGDLAALRASVDKDPKDRAARFALVRALMRAKQFDEALAAAKAWRSIDAYNLVVVRLLGDVYSELGDRNNARRAYSAVVELLPKDASAHRALASVLKQAGDLKGAYDRLRAAEDAGGSDRRLAFELADVAARLGQTDEAKQRFESIVADPETHEAVRYPAQQRLNAISGGTVNDIKVYLTWDTDHSDVDLWVTTPAGEKVFYSHRKGKNGEALFDDVTTGHGPEAFTAAKAASGEYLVQVNYFGRGRSNFSEARGEVTIVLDEGRPTESKQVLPYRLYDEKQTVTVAKVRVGGAQ